MSNRIQANIQQRQPQLQSEADAEKHGGQGEAVAGQVATAATVSGYALANGSKAAAGVAVAADSAKVSAAAGRIARAARTASRGMTVVGAAATAVNRYQHTTARTAAGKAADVVGSTAVSLAFGAAMPAVAAADALSGGRVSKHLQGSVAGPVALAETFETGDLRPAIQYVEQAKRGEHGPVLKAAAEVGEQVEGRGRGGHRFLGEARLVRRSQGCRQGGRIVVLVTTKR